MAIGRISAAVRTHRRHFLQQGAYTYCYTIRREGIGATWYFMPHEDYFADPSVSCYELYKLSIPVEERINALYRLDQLNLNPYSLFGTVESLMESIALRTIEYSYSLIPPQYK